MTAFSAAIDAIFADPNMAADALYRPARSSIDTPCRVILSLPDADTDYGAGSVVSDTQMIDVRVSEVAAPTAGDRFTVNGEALVVQGEPMRDRMRLVWKCEAVPAERPRA
jgi:hypothetical protein